MYQADHFEQLFLKYPKKLRALCTDNASVMRKTWRLLRDRLKNIFTYGCGAHGFQLHAKDICALDLFQTTVAEINSIVAYFGKHLQAGGLATLREIQRTLFGKEKALVKAGKTRWNSQIDAAQSLIDSQPALVSVVNHCGFKKTDDTAKAVRRLVLDIDHAFWPRVELLIRVLTPIRFALLELQSDSATMADVYAQWLGVYGEHASIPVNEHFDEGIKAELLAILDKRMDFLIHPLHFVAYAFHPRHAKVSQIPMVVARKWLKEIVRVGNLVEGVEEWETLLDQEITWWINHLVNHKDYASAWTPAATRAHPVRPRRAARRAGRAAAARRGDRL